MPRVLGLHVRPPVEDCHSSSSVKGYVGRIVHREEGAAGRTERRTSVPRSDDRFRV